MAYVEPFYIGVGQRLKAIRESCGMSQKTLGERVGLSRPTINNIERGHQRLLGHHAVELAAALGCSPKDILIGT